MSIYGPFLKKGEIYNGHRYHGEIYRIKRTKRTFYHDKSFMAFLCDLADKFYLRGALGEREYKKDAAKGRELELF